MMTERLESVSKGQGPRDDETARALQIKFFDEHYPNWRENSKRRKTLADLQNRTFGRLLYAYDPLPEGPFLPYTFRSDQHGEGRFGVYIGWQVRSLDEPSPTDLSSLEEFTAELLSGAAGCGPEELRNAEFRLFNNQCEGHACSQQEFLARPIEPTAEFRSVAKEICVQFWMSGWGSLGEFANSYLKSRLAAAGLDGLEFYDGRTDIVEACYPIPLTENNLRQITGKSLTIGDALSPLGADAALSARAQIHIIADNSD